MHDPAAGGTAAAEALVRCRCPGFLPVIGNPRPVFEFHPENDLRIEGNIDDVDDARKVLRCLDALEECDDVQNVFSNHDFSDDVIVALSEAS